MTFRNVWRVSLVITLTPNGVEVNCRYYQTKRAALTWASTWKSRYSVCSVDYVKITERAWRRVVQLQTRPDVLLPNRRNHKKIYLDDVELVFQTTAFSHLDDRGAREEAFAAYVEARLQEDPVVYEAALDAYFKECAHVDR